MTVELLPFERADLELLEPREELAAGRDMVLRYGLEWVYEGPYAYTLWHVSGVPLACAGVIPSTWEAWAFLGRQIDTWSAYLFTRYTAQYGLRPWVRDTGLPAIAYVDPAVSDAVKWVRVLGFEPTDEWKNSKRKWKFYA